MHHSTISFPTRPANAFVKIYVEDVFLNFASANMSYELSCKMKKKTHLKVDKRVFFFKVNVFARFCQKFFQGNASYLTFSPESEATQSKTTPSITTLSIATLNITG